MPDNRSKLQIHNGVNFFTVATGTKDRLPAFVDFLLEAAEQEATAIPTTGGKSIRLERGDCLVRQEEAAACIGVSLPTIQRYVATLKELGFLRADSFGPYGARLRVNNFDHYKAAA